MAVAFFEVNVVNCYTLYEIYPRGLDIKRRDCRDNAILKGWMGFVG